jgi:hypothetical protein
VKKGSARILLLVLGLLIGGVTGWLTRPAAAELTIGPLQIEVQGDRPAEGSGPLTTGQIEHVALYAVIGGLIGFLIGFAVDRRTPA